MNTIASDVAMTQVLAVLKEVFEGPGAFFIDADGSLFQTLDKLSAADASRLIGNNTIAGQIGHTTLGVRASAYWIMKNPTQPDWSQSWAITTVDTARWEQLKADLRAAYGELRDAIQGHGADDAETFGAAVGGIAHIVYHLGTIRQKAAIVRQG